MFLNKERNHIRIQQKAYERINFLMDSIAGGMTGYYLEEGFPLYFMNQWMLRFLGYQNQLEYSKATGGFVLNSILPQDRKHVRENIMSQLAKHNEYEMEFRMIKKDGSLIWIHEKGKKIITVDGRQAIISLSVDINLQKEYENQLALYRKTASGAFIVLIAEHYPVLYGNDIFYSMFEITKDEMAKRHNYGSSLIYQEDLPALKERLEEAIKNHSIDFQMETRIMTGQGNIKWFLINGTLENRSEGLVLNGFVIDFTENNLLKQEIIHKELVYRTALNQTHFKVWEYDIKNHALLLSGKLRNEYLFKERIERIPESLIEHELVHPGSRDDLFELYRQLDEGPPHVQADILSRYSSDSPWIWQRLRYTTLYDENNNPSSAVAVVEDITRQKEAEMQYQQDLQLRMAFNNSLISSFRCNLDTNNVEYVEGPSIKQFVPGISYEELMEIHNKSMANQEDALRLKHLMKRNALIKAFNEGTTNLSFEYRRKDDTGKLLWVCASIYLMRDAHNGNLYAYGTLQDINEKKVLELSMKDRAEHDLLTGAYNKATAIQLISDSLVKTHRHKDSCAFLIFHVNNFNQIVYDCGYIIADKILQEVARQLMQSNNDKIISRFYGEEFVVYIYNNPQPKIVTQYARQVLSTIALPYMFPESKYPITLSVGIVFDNSTNSTFESLYNKAHLALAAVDTSGQDGLFIYSDSLEDIAFSQESSSKERKIPLLQEYSDFGMNLMFKCMYSITSSFNFTQALENILKELGQYYQSDRVYIIEMKQKKHEINSIYEWHNENIVSIHNNDELYRNLIDIFDSITYIPEGIHYENHLNDYPNPKVQKIVNELNVHSHFITTLNEGKDILGYLGIDNPTQNINDTTILNGLRYILSSELTKYRMQEKQKFLSYHDGLTGMLNRYSFQEYQEELEEESLISMGVVSLDINGLKEINKKNGNNFGDNIVRYLAKIISEVFSHWKIYRLAGDEFLIICENISSDTFNQNVNILKEQLNKICSVSVGSAWQDEDIRLGVLMENADERRIIDKQNYYNEKGIDHGRHNNEIRQNLLLALKQDKFTIYLQPKIDSRTGKNCGAEALIRYYDPKTGLITPIKFISYLEHAGLIHYIDFFVLRQVCIMLKNWKDRGIQCIPISLNFSRSTLLEANLIQRMEKVVNQWDIDKSFIEIEITESLGAIESETITRIGSQIKAAGYHIALDDFGSKYSNISFLSSLHFDYLKLDKGLVNNLMTNERSRLIVKNIVRLCHDLNVNVIAEGVENQEQVEILRSLKCYFIQGYYYDKPITISTFEKRYL